MADLLADFDAQFSAALDKVATGNAGDPATQAAVKTLTDNMNALVTRVSSDEASDAEVKNGVQSLQTAILALANKLAAAPAPTGDTSGTGTNAAAGGNS